jgi:hypothetical protein
MAFAFDTLSYAKHLRDAGVPQQQAEAHAEAARQFIMSELVTKTDLLALETRIDQKFEIFDQKFATFDQKLDNLSLRLTVRLGVMFAAGIAVLAAVIKL